MNKESNFAAEARAFASLGKLMDLAAETDRLFREAGLGTPEPLARLFGVQDEDKRSNSIPRLQGPERPHEAGEAWFWVKLEDMLVGGIVLATLRDAGEPLRPKQIIEKVLKIRPDIPSGSIYNIGPRLDKSGTIKRGEQGWQLIDPNDAPILSGGVAWGPKEVFAKQEVAAHRRYIILHILETCRSGLQIIQMVDQLVAYGECRAPINKDLVKADLNVLQEEGKVRRSYKKFVLAERENE